MKKSPDKITEFIHRLTGRKYPSKQVIHPSRYLEDIFSKGNCGNLALALKALFPEGELCMLDGWHIVFRYNKKVYDIRGEIPYPHRLSLEVLSEEWLEKSHFKNNYTNPHEFCNCMDKLVKK